MKTIDERLEALTERHESLTMSVQMMLAESQEQTKHIQALVRVAELHGQQLAKDADHIRILASLAETHDNRLNELERK